MRRVASFISLLIASFLTLPATAVFAQSAGTSDEWQSVDNESFFNQPLRADLEELSNGEVDDYRINRRFFRNSHWEIYLASVSKSPRYLTVNVLYYNRTNRYLSVFCPGHDDAEMRFRGQTMGPTSGYCSDHPNSTIMVPPKKALLIWASFLNILGDSNQPFALRWYNVGTVRNVRLNRPVDEGFTQDPAFQRLLDVLHAAVVGYPCIDRVWHFTKLAGYPHGTLVGLMTTQCIQLYSQGLYQGVELYQCLLRYRNNPGVCFGFG